MPPPRLRPRLLRLPIRPPSSRPFSHISPNTTACLFRKPTPAPQSPIHVQRRHLRSISQPAPLPSRYDAKLPALGASHISALRRRQLSDTLPLRTGALALKRGMTSLYDPITAERMPCTVLQLDLAQVVGHKTFKDHGYFAVQIGSGTRHPKNVGKAMMTVFANNNLPPKRNVREFKVRDRRGLVSAPVGMDINADWFKEGQFVDVRGVTHGKGFAGGMKRWGFGGQPASHGVSLKHRSMGSSGGGQGSGSRVHPGKKMPGRLGGENHTVLNLKVLKVDAENGIVVVSGAVPGPKKGLVKIRDAVMKAWPDVDLGPPAPQTVLEPLREAVDETQKEGQINPQ